MNTNDASLNFSSVQLNIAIFVDVWKIAESRALDGAVYMMDNSPASLQKGTPRLQTCCKQGQTLNWIIYPLDVNKRADGSWPPSARIKNIVFINERGDTLNNQPMNNLKIYGAPDSVRSPYTDVYSYWAGIVPIELSPNIYSYRLMLEVETEKRGAPFYLNLDKPSLKVIALSAS
jgi:hypothetical protein